MVVLLSCAFAAPAGLLAWRLSGTRVRGSDLALGFSGGVFGGTLVLAVLAPLVALYYHSSAWAGPVLGIGSVGLALLAGTVMFVRGVVRRLEPGTRKRTVLLPVAVTLGDAAPHARSSSRRSRRRSSRSGRCSAAGSITSRSRVMSSPPRARGVTRWIESSFARRRFGCSSS